MHRFGSIASVCRRVASCVQVNNAAWAQRGRREEEEAVQTINRGKQRNLGDGRLGGGRGRAAFADLWIVEFGIG